VVDEFHGEVDESGDRQLSQGAPFIDGVHHADVEGGRLVEAADRVVKEDVGVFEEPGDQYQGQRDAEETCSGGEGEEEGEDDQDAGGSAAGGAEEVGEDFSVRDL